MGLRRNALPAVLLAAALAAATGAACAAEDMPAIPTDAGAKASFAAGVTAYQDGALEVAIETLSQALQGGLSGADTAEAFYYRGMAYRELGRPGQAITDLSAAIALGGLSKGHLKLATRNRSGAYREAGITEKETVVTSAMPGSNARVPVGVPANRTHVPVAAAEQLPPSDVPPPTPPAPAVAEPGIVSALQKLVPDWP